MQDIVVLLLNRYIDHTWPKPFHVSLCDCNSLCFSDGDAVLDGGTAAGSWFSVTDLQPFTIYSFWVRGCNTRGCVESLPLTVTTPPAGTNIPRTKTTSVQLFSFLKCMHLASTLLLLEMLLTCCCSSSLRLHCSLDRQKQRLLKMMIQTPTFCS